MTKKRKELEKRIGLAFEEALARFIQTNPKEVADQFIEVKARQEEVRKNAEERKAFIERAGRPGGKRFRL